MLSNHSFKAFLAVSAITFTTITACGDKDEKDYRGERRAQIPNAFALNSNQDKPESILSLPFSVKTFRAPSETLCYQAMQERCEAERRTLELTSVSMTSPKLGSACRRAGGSDDWLGGPVIVCHFSRTTQSP